MVSSILPATDAHLFLNMERETMSEPVMKDVTPKKERVRVSAGRGGGPVVLPREPSNIPMPLVRPTGGDRTSEPKSVLAIIADAAANPAINPAVMRELLDMKKEIMAEEARLAFINAKLLLNDKLPTINKDGKIEFKDKGAGKAVLKFASFENINDVIKPLLKEFGFDLWFSSEPGLAGMINVVGHMEHRLGFGRATTFPMPHDGSGGKSGAQGWASAFSFGKRVTTIGLLNIQTRAIEDRDRDGNGSNFKPAKGGGYAEVAEEVGPISPAQRDKLVDLITAAKIKEQQFCVRYGINQIIQLPADLYDAAVAAIEAHRAGAAAAKRDGARG
jgi:hypothetical protein